MENNSITCGRCKSTFQIPPGPFNSKIMEQKTACPLCGYSKQDVVESSDKPKKKILKG